MSIIECIGVNLVILFDKRVKYVEKAKNHWSTPNRLTLRCCDFTFKQGCGAGTQISGSSSNIFRFLALERFGPKNRKNMVVFTYIA